MLASSRQTKFRCCPTCVASATAPCMVGVSFWVGYPDDVPVPAFGPRMVCTVCGAIGADVRPNWQEHARATLFGGRLIRGVSPV